MCVLFLFTHPSIGVHLGCFYLLAVVNSTALNMMLTYFFGTLFSVPLDIYSKVGFLYHIMVIFLIFLSNLHTHFHRGYTILHSHQQFQCYCPSLPTLVTLLLFFDSSHSNGHEVMSHCGFDLHFSINKLY